MATRFEQTVQEQQQVIHDYMRYIPLGGASRRYLNPYTGETISRHAYDKLKRDVSAPKGRFIFQREDELQPDIIAEYKRANDITVGTLRDSQIARSASFQNILVNLSDNTGEYIVNGKKFYPPDSPKAYALVRLGRRQIQDSWPVGATPEEE